MATLDNVLEEIKKNNRLARALPEPDSLEKHRICRDSLAKILRHGYNGEHQPVIERTIRAMQFGKLGDEKCIDTYRYVAAILEKDEAIRHQIENKYNY